MTENKQFTDDGHEAIEDQSFTDNLTEKTYYVDYFDEIIDLCNNLWEQSLQFGEHDILWNQCLKLKKYNQKLTKENKQLKQNIR